VNERASEGFKSHIESSSYGTDTDDSYVDNAAITITHNRTILS